MKGKILLAVLLIAAVVLSGCINADCGTSYYYKVYESDSQDKAQVLREIFKGPLSDSYCKSYSDSDFNEDNINWSADKTRPLAGFEYYTIVETRHCDWINNNGKVMIARNGNNYYIVTSGMTACSDIEPKIIDTIPNQIARKQYFS